MRPFPSNTFPGASFSRDLATDAFGTAPMPPQVAYILTDEAVMDMPNSISTHPSPFARENRKNGWRNHIDRVDNPPDATNEALSRPPLAHQLEPQTGRQANYDTTACSKSIDQNMISGRNQSNVQASPYANPPMVEISGPGSAISSFSSRQDSPTGSISDYPESYIMGSAGDSVVESSSRANAACMPPQFIMPTITVPRRRPFTDVGKSLGRLKILVAGRSGIGKSSLIKAIVQTCEHIVHVDPIQTSLQSSFAKIHESNNDTISQCEYRRTANILEIYASTKPYPSWWTESDESGLLRQSRGSGDEVLDRNLCLVDTPGFGLNPDEVPNRLIRYVESHLQRNALPTLSDRDLLNTLVGSGGLLVDAVLYMMSCDGPTQPELQLLRQLQTLTNIIPVLALAEASNSAAINSVKDRITRELEAARIDTFIFSGPMFKCPPGPGVYAVSTAETSQLDSADSSYLTISDYTQPPVQADLSCLMEDLFSPNGSSWVRHAAAKKLLRWRNVHAQQTSALLNPISRSVSWDAICASPSRTTRSLVLARIGDQALAEGPSRRIQFADWATDLQRSLARDRTRYGQFIIEQRSSWLAEEPRGDETSASGMTLTRINGLRRENKDEGANRYQAWKSVSCQDPLGLLQLGIFLARKGMYALEVAGSLGLFGGAMVWLLV